MEFWHRFLALFSGAAFRQAGLQSGLPPYRTQSAVPVTIDAALQLSAVWACAKLITESVASLPIYVYKKDPITGLKTLWYDHPLMILFGGRINRWQTKNEYFETLTYQQVMLGNSYSVIQRGAGGRIIGLIPLMTEQMQVTLLNSGELIYRYLDGANVNIYSEKSIWHNKGFGNGVIGLSPLGFARNSVGIGLAAEETVSKVYANGGKPSGVLTIDKLLTPEQRDKVRANFKELAEGENNRLFVLEAGMQYSPVSLSPQDIELLSSRKFQIEDIARFFGVPSVLINDTGASTTWGSGIQQIVQGFYKLGLRPYLDRLKESMRIRLFKPEEWPLVEIEFDICALTQQDLSDRIKMYKDGVQGGIMTPDEARNEEGWSPMEGGDQLYMQRQMIALKDLPNVQGGAQGYVPQSTN